MPKIDKLLQCVWTCIFLTTISNVAYAQPKADFSISNISGCSPLSETFSDLTSGGNKPYTWFWRLGNSNTSILASPGAIYITPGGYKITLIVTDASGKKDSISKSITVFADPKAGIKSNITSGCLPLTVTFDDNSTPGSASINKWLWDFGDGNISTSKNPGQHQFTKSGKYSISLKVTDNNGCTGSLVLGQYINVNAPPVVDFKANTTAGCNAPQTINFTSTVTSSSPVTYVWDFGDGTTGSGANPGKQYTSNGTYTVTLTCTDGSGCVTSVVKKNYIIIGTPTPSFTPIPYKGCSPLVVKFTNTTSGYGNSYHWDFGDGTTSNSVVPTHTYSTGIFTVKLVVTSPAGCVDSSIINGAVQASPGFTPSFTSDTIACANQTNVLFQNTNKDVSYVLWDYGDGGFGQNTISSHIYGTKGIYSVKMTVADNSGCTETLTKTRIIDVKQELASFTPPFSKGCAPLTVNFTNTSSGNDSIVSVHWDFGDGQTSNARYGVIHTFTDTGFLNVTMSIKTKNGCTSNSFALVRVGLKPQANFTGGPYKGCYTQIAKDSFTNLSNSGNTVHADSFYWLPMDTNTVNVKVKCGSYDVTLIAFNNECPDTIVKKKWVTTLGPCPSVPGGVGGGLFNCLQNKVTFTDSSKEAVKVTYYFGDGDSSSQQTSEHVYNAGSYKPYEIIFDSASGCHDTFNISGSSDGYLNIPKPWIFSIKPIDGVNSCLSVTDSFILRSNTYADYNIYYGDGMSDEVDDTKDTSVKIVAHTYTKPGTYQVTVTGINGAKCTIIDTIPQKISIYGPRASFSVNKTKGCVPFTIQLIDSSTTDSTIVSKEYDMGNGDIVKITSRTMTYTYKTLPKDQHKGYKIILKVKGKYCNATDTIQVFPTGPHATIITYDNATCDSVQYQFYHLDAGIAPFTYFWDFGKGDTTRIENPTHSFPPGTYTVKLQVKDSLGCIDTTSQNLKITTNKSIADFSINVAQSSCPAFTVKFTDQSKFSTYGTYAWNWDFGDGSASTQENPSKVYFVAGNFDISLTITDALGCKYTVIKPHVVKIKGPKGDYAFDVTNGCTPLTVHFSAISSNASKFSWDLGDGTIANGDTVTHVYKIAKHYLPLLILSDSSGCTYTLPPKDTIFVYGQPKSDFIFDTTCSGLPIHFQDMSDPVSGTLMNWKWDFGDGGAGAGPTPIHTYIKNGYYPVVLATTNSYGCIGSIEKPVRSGSIIAGFKVQPTSCIGSTVQFADLTSSKSAIVSWLWLFGDGSTSSLQNPSHTYLTKGRFPVSLYVKNAIDCSDSLKMSSSIIIGDTVPPPAPILYRATVVDDHSVEVDFGKFKDVDFAKYVIYMPDNSGNFVAIDSITNQNDTIYTAHNLNTLHNVYCFEVQCVNVCGYKSKMSPDHCTVNLTANPGINEALLSWTPYIGWDVAQYKIYRQGSVPMMFGFIDSVPGSQLNYIDTTVVCYRPMIYKVEAIENGGNRQISWSDTSATIPVHIPKVPATEVIRATVVENKNTLIEWKQRPNAHVRNFVLEKSNDGVNFKALDTSILSTVFNITDQKVDVQNNSYTYRVKIIDSCGDVGQYSNIGKTILLKVDTTPDVLPDLTWSAYKNWPDDIAYYDIEIKDANGNFTWLARTNNGNTTEFIDNITDINSLPEYTYHVIAQRNNQTYGTGNTIISNDATLHPHSRLFVPNAFTPNNDTHNDSFFVEGMYIKDFHMRIFDRWGTKVFESNAMKDKWGGDFRKGTPIQDAYKYLIYYRGIDGNDGYLSGWVTILE